MQEPRGWRRGRLSSAQVDTRHPSICRRASCFACELLSRCRPAPVTSVCDRLQGGRMMCSLQVSGQASSRCDAAVVCSKPCQTRGGPVPDCGLLEAGESSQRRQLAAAGVIEAGAADVQLSQGHQAGQTAELVSTHLQTGKAMEKRRRICYVEMQARGHCLVVRIARAVPLCSVSRETTAHLGACQAQGGQLREAQQEGSAAAGQLQARQIPADRQEASDGQVGGPASWLLSFCKVADGACPPALSSGRHQ